MNSLTNLWSSGEDFVLLESLQDSSQSYLLKSPQGCLTAQNTQELDAFWLNLEAALDKGLYAAGFFCYELGYFLEEAFEPLRKNFSDLLSVGLFSEVQTWQGPLPDERHGDPQFFLGQAQWQDNFEQYQKLFEEVQKSISRGQTYQVNLTTRVQYPFKGSVCDFYHALKAQQKVSYAALIRQAGRVIMSFSPELFVRREGQNLVMKPMKGTAPLNDHKPLDCDPKNQSENVMIVDLLRNDLGKICKQGTVQVDSLFDLESFQTVQQMTSSIQAELKDEVRLKQIFKALFPCGSVTGAPKISAMSVIERLEKTPREIYTGAIGMIAPSRDMSLSVAIRSLEFKDDVWQMGVGSGVVADSQAQDEYRECALKQSFVQNCSEDFSLIETMCVDDHTVLHLDLHFERLCRSAQMLDLPCSKMAWQTCIDQALSECDAERKHGKLRVLMNREGQFSYSLSPFNLKLDDQPSVCISTEALNSQNPWLAHKTTVRRLYEQELKKAQEKQCVDALFFNERDELCEAAIHNVYLKMNGTLYTSPLSSGVLPGVMRRVLIEQKHAVVRVLKRKDLFDAQEIYLSNSLRGLYKAVLAGHYD